MSAETRSDKDNTAKEPSSADSHTARDPTLSEDSNTAREISSSKNITAREPGTDTDQDNRIRIKEEIEGSVPEVELHSPTHGGYVTEEYDMTSVMFNRSHPTDPATAEAEAARKKKLAAKKK